MLANLAIIGFVPISDFDRARRFYVDLLKLKFEEQNPFAVVVSAAGNTIRLVKVEDPTPAPFTILGWEDPGIETTVRELTAAGLKFERYAYLEQDALGIWTTPDGSKVAWFKDPDGNVLSLSQH